MVNSTLRIQGKFFVGQETLYGDWFPSSGSNVIHRAQLVFTGLTGASHTLTVDLLTKAIDETSDQATLVASIEFDKDDPVETIKEVIVYDDSVKEQVRYRVISSGGNGSVRMFPPIFFDAAKR